MRYYQLFIMVEIVKYQSYHINVEETCNTVPKHTAYQDIVVEEIHKTQIRARKK